MADPAVHVFNDRLYIYPSHDWESGIPENDNGDHFNMKDYHVFSTDDPMKGEIVDHGLVLTTEDIPWAGRQLWDCDVAEKDGKYYMYFPLKDQNDIFRIGVAISDRPEGPFIPQPDPMRGSYSIDPAVLNDGDGNYYMYLGRTIATLSRQQSPGKWSYFPRRQRTVHPRTGCPPQCGHAAICRRT